MTIRKQSLMTDNRLKIIFMGTPDFAVPALQALIDSGHDVVAVYSQPPRPKGRGQKVQKSPVHLVADDHDIPVFTPKSLKNKEAQQEFSTLNADVAVVAAYGLILPTPVLDAPKHGCINIHGSLLPRWRGAAPIQYAIWKGDTESGIAIMQMEKGLDTGPVISMESTPITAETTAQSLHDALSEMGARMIVETMDVLADKQSVETTPQDDSLSTYASMLSRDDGRVDWSQDAADIDRQIRALTPWPSVSTTTPDEKRLKIHQAILHDSDNDAVPGTLLDKNGLVQCGHKTALQLLSVQPENARAMDIASAVNGHYLTVGDKLG